MLEIHWNGPVRVVTTEYEVQSETKLGWRLLAILQEQMAGYLSNGSTYVPGPIMTKYVIGLDKQSTLVDACAKLSDAQIKLDDQAKEIARIQKAVEQSITAFALAEADVADYRRTLEAERSARKPLQESIARYERDLAKIRTAIGEIKLREILG